MRSAVRAPYAPLHELATTSGPLRRRPPSLTLCATWQDLTESSSIGALLSVVTIAALLLLAVLQAKAALAVGTSTRVEVDHSEDGTFSMNLKVTLPELSCEWAALESVDAVGNRRRHDLASSAVYKSPIGGRVVALEHAAKAPQPVPALVGAGTDMDHYANRRVATELTPAWFDAFVQQNDVALVVFHAPWCPHCQTFAPVWEHAAELVLQRLAAQHARRTATSPAPPRVSLGSVDCTVGENKELCKRAHVMAYPTVRVFRAGSQGTAFDDAQHAHHESYTGERTAEAVADFAMTVAQEVLTKSGSVSNAEPGAYSLGWTTPGTDANADGVKDSRVLSRGCTLEGTVRLARVPGEIQVVPHAVSGVSFDMAAVNLTHTIDHLSFGSFVPSRSLYAGWYDFKKRRLLARLPKDRGGKFAGAAAASHPPWVAREQLIEYLHSFGVVAVEFRPLSGSEPVTMYEYSSATFEHALQPPFTVAGERHDGPMVRLGYSVSPMHVVIEEQRKPALDSILGMCAILGGVYTVFHILEGMLQAMHATVKRAAGKTI